MEIKLLMRNYNGIFISWHRFWKGVYFNFRGFTIRLFLWGIDWHYNKLDKLLKKMTVKWEDIEWDINKKDPKRINRISKLIGKIWRKNPDLRLCQIIYNASPHYNTFYIKDEELEKKLREIYNV